MLFLSVHSPNRTPSRFFSVFAVKLRTYVSCGERRYLDTGEEIPDVPRSCLRVLTLTVGMKVEARFSGGLDFYPGSICGVNER